MVLAAAPAIITTYGEDVPGPVLAAGRAAVEALVALSDDAYGLQWSDYADPAWRPSRADIHLNAWAVWLARSVRVKLPASPSPALADYAAAWARVGSQADAWAEAVSRQLLQDAYDARTARWGGTPVAYSDWWALAWSRLALGAEWSPSRCTGGQSVPYCAPGELAATLAADLSWSRLVGEAARGADQAGLQVSAPRRNALRGPCSCMQQRTLLG